MEYCRNTRDPGPERRSNTPESRDRAKTGRDWEVRLPNEKAYRTEEPMPGDRADGVHQPKRKEAGRRSESERTEIGQNNPGYTGAEKTADYLEPTRLRALTTPLRDPIKRTSTRCTAPI